MASLSRWTQTRLDFLEPGPSPTDIGLELRDTGSTDRPLWGTEGPLAEAVRRALSARLAALTRRHVELTITDNRCSLLHARTENQTLFLRLHHMFLDAPDRTVRALARYLARGDRKAGAVVDAFIQKNQGKVTSGPPPHRILRTEGEVHDLEQLFSELNRTWFADALDVRVTWGRKTSPRRSRRRSLRLGVYVFSDRLIRIHPVLDQDWVPEFFVRYVLFHEMLHVVTPPEERGGRKAYHGPQFRKRERAYPDYQRAVEWERVHLDRLLRS